MATTPEALALDLSRAILQAQDATENQLREKATTVLSAASIVVPVAAVAVGVGKGPAVAAIPFGGGAAAYFFCVQSCCAALLPQGFRAGLLGSEMLRVAEETKADLRQMQASAASYLDQGYAHNQSILEGAATRVYRSIQWLMAEILLLAVALVVTLVS